MAFNWFKKARERAGEEFRSYVQDNPEPPDNVYETTKEAFRGFYAALKGFFNVSGKKEHDSEKYD